MTPERISIQGFLCYRERQDVCFAGRSLWMLSGPNGSGKSTLFDAITFSLYGWHRGGKQNAEALINRHSDGFVVEFDFRIENQLYQARRVMRRGGGVSRQIRRWLPAPEGGAWEEIAGTDTQRGFDAWVNEQIGLTADTFTASVMLRQNGAERLLEAKPADRHAFLKEIVGLRSYEQLHDSAKDRANQAKYDSENLSRQLTNLPEITADELTKANQTLEEYQGALNEANSQVQALSEHLIHSQHWKTLDNQRLELEQKMQSFTTLLAERGSIEQQHAEFQFLNLHLPTLQNCVEMHQKLKGEKAEILNIQNQQQKIASELKPLTTELSRVTSSIQKAETNRDRQQEQCREIEQKLHQFKNALPWLEVLAEERKAIAETRRNAKAATEKLNEIESERNRIESETPTKESVERAEQTLNELQKQMGEFAERHREAQERLKRFHEVRNEQTCRYCGQELPPEHIASEAAHLHEERQSAQAAFEQIQSQHQVAKTKHTELQTLKQTS
ncbi:MAG: SMC family ATPase [Planctomycetaceae bacterium]|nr:SMC family ATPase [Planctomycetaceae bacterium]